MLPNLVWEKFHIVHCRTILIAAAKKTHFNKTSKTGTYFLSFCHFSDFRIISFSKYLGSSGSKSYSRHVSFPKIDLSEVSLHLYDDF